MTLSCRINHRSGAVPPCVATVVGVLAIVVFAACENRGPSPPVVPTSPSAAPVGPAPPAAPVWNWNLTTVLTSATGPDNCFTERQVYLGIPRSISWQLAVTRTGNAVTFDYDVRNYPTDDLQLTGTIDGNTFTANSVTQPSSFPPCPDGTVLSGTFDSTVSGQFSDDGKHVIAKEIWSYHFSTGEVRMSLDWSADQR